MNDSEIKEKIESLERENRALRDAMNRQGKSNVIVVTEGSYQGHPTISFEASGRPFALGLRKAAVVLHCSANIRAFVQKHNAELQDVLVLSGVEAKSADSREGDLQI